jgi:DOPA 4,5-dioxygenase
MTQHRPLGAIASYHAHVYFEPAARDAAMAVREGVAERFAVRLGTVWDNAVGPHSRAMFQIAFGPEQFGSLVPWLMLNNCGLSILIHPNTDNPRRGHLIDAMWIGAPLSLDGEVLPEAAEAELAGPPNTAPSVAP